MHNSSSTVFWALLAGAVNWRLPATAASFDCGKAKSAFERAICSDHVLSSTDEKMSAAYTAAQSPLSPSGRALLRDSQRSFLHYADNLCRPGSRPLDQGDRSVANMSRQTDQEQVIACLTGAFQTRIDKLAKSIHRAADMLFISATTYAVRPTTYEFGGDTLPAIDTQVLTLLQIDNPKSNSERIWNEKMLNWLSDTSTWPPAAGHDSSFEKDNEDLVVGEELAGASPELISVVFTNWGYEKAVLMAIGLVEQAAGF